jgi:hypothetical protein
MEITKVIIGFAVVTILNLLFYRMGFNFGKAAGLRESLKVRRDPIFTFVK